MSVALTGLLFAGAWICDHFTLPSKPACIFIGSLSLCATLALVIFVSLVEILSATVDPNRGRPLEILGIWLFNAFLIALLGLMGVVILAALFTKG